MRNTTISLAVLAALALPLAASAQTFILQGVQGPPGEAQLDCDGSDCTLVNGQTLTVNGDLTATGHLDALTTTVTDSTEVLGVATFGGIQASDLAVNDSYMLPDCPEGYELDPAGVGITLCTRVDGSGDEVVAVGDFWIDRYEVSMWSEPGCTGIPYGTSSDDYPDGVGASFPDTGNWDVGAEVFACSVEGVTPAVYLSWFQAQQACSLAGKSLCSNAQWQAAAAGTPDDTTCNIDHGAPEATGVNMGCESVWGTTDQVGGVWEWVAMWEGHPGWNGAENLMSSEYGSDGYWAGGPAYGSMPAYGTDGSWRPGSPSITGNGDAQGEYYGPAATARGGNWEPNSRAGVFALSVAQGPSYSSHALGTRCCINR